MFVLRSYDPESDSVSRPDIGPVPVTNDQERPGHPTPVDLAAARQERDWLPREVPTPESAATTARPTGARERSAASMQMPLFAAAFAIRFGGAKAASACPKHFADVQALIDQISAGIDRSRDRMPQESVELVHALLDDARMFLETARRNHERPCGPYDHARAFAKADAALGHARAAQIVYSRSTRA